MRATVSVHSGFAVGAVDPRLFGGFLEHIGRAVYQGVFEPGSPQADARGFRRDVLALLRGLRMTAMRYPGGNFASGYHWEDGVGPHRPTVRELAWQSLEPNTFGTDEYLALCRAMDWTPMLTVNLGTGTPEEARQWVEYCNGPVGSKYADRRAANGSPAPYGVALWCLGNEMDGAWQLGHVPADQYAIRAQQAAKMMKDTDRRVELVACGSCGIAMPTYLEWDRVVLEYLGDAADYVSLHRYVGNTDGTADFLAVTNSVDRQIEEMDAVCRVVQAKRRSATRAYLCFDEWNVWYKNHEADGAGAMAPHLLEEVYTLEDALVVAGFLHSFLRHADVVKIANLAQIVNVIAPVLTQGDRALAQSIYYPFAMFSRRRDGVSLRPLIDAPTYESTHYGTASLLDASAVLGAGVLHVFLTNRSLDRSATVTVQAADREITGLVDGELLTGDDPQAANRFDAPETVVSRPFDAVHVAHGRAELTLPPLSVAAVTLRCG